MRRVIGVHGILFLSGKSSGPHQNGFTSLYLHSELCPVKIDFFSNFKILKGLFKKEEEDLFTDLH